MDATTEALETMARTLPREGTTAFFPTTMTQAKEKIAAALENAAAFMEHHNARGQAEVTGIHLEGPFINPVRKGAQPEEYVILPDPSFSMNGKSWRMEISASSRSHRKGKTALLLFVTSQNKE